MTTADRATLTVGIPTYNRSGLLREAIESVLAQTYRDFRLVISDNASDDDTEAVVRSFDDPRIHYVRSPENVGPIRNFNRLLELTATELVMLLPDDDVLYPDYLETAVELLERNPSVGLVHCAVHVIDETSDVLQSIHPVAAREPITLERRDDALERLMVSGSGMCFSSVVYRTAAIVAAGGLRAEEEPFGDRALWMRLALGWDFGYVARPLVGFRPHADTITSRIASELGAESDQRAFLLYSQINFQRRMDFLDDAPLGRRRADWLRALAILQRLTDRAAFGLAPAEVVRSLADVVRTSPRMVFRPPLWRFVAAELGGRRARAALARLRPARVTRSGGG